MNTEKLIAIAEAEGYADIEALLAAASLDSVVPGICLNCNAVTECEPDADANWCPSCAARRVTSCLVLAGII